MMRKLQRTWAGFFVLGLFLVAVDFLAGVLISIGAVPAVGVMGGALMLLVCTSVLNWIFKTAWDERSRSGAEPGAPESG